MDNFTPNQEEMPPIEELINQLKVDETAVTEVISSFVANPPIPELANLPLAEPE